MNLTRSLLTLTLGLLPGAWGAAPHLSAQANPLTPPTHADGRIPITLVLTATAAAPTVHRRADGEPRNVILLDSATSDVQQLSDAVFHLLILEAQDPQGQRRSNHAAQRIRLDQPHPVYPWAGEALGRLRSAPRRPLDALRPGQRYRTMQIWVRPLRGIRR